MLLFTLALNYAVSARNNGIQIDATSSSAVFPSTGATGETQSQMPRLTTYENKIAELELKLKGMYQKNYFSQLRKKLCRKNLVSAKHVWYFWS